MNSVKLIERRGEKFSVHLSAKIDKDGDLVLEGQDLGSGVEEYWGDSDYEYWVVVRAKDKMTTFLKMSQYAFKNIGKLIEWLEESMIDYKAIKGFNDEQYLEAEVDADKIVFNVHAGNLGIKKLEPILTIDRKHEDALLISLLEFMFKHELFKSDSDFMEWMKGQGIEYNFDSYV
jgi:hypothetical protein